MKSNYFLSGIQQIGIGTTHFVDAWNWYIQYFNMDIKILEDNTVAELMLPYTGQSPQRRRACIAVNLQGGGGFEIWQYADRKPKLIDFKIQAGDLGIFAAKVKSRNVVAFYQQLKSRYDRIGEITCMPDGTPCFFLEDPFGNYFQVVQDSYVFIDRKQLSGGIVGAMIGVSNIEKALPVYQDILGFDRVVYDVTGTFEDWAFLRGGHEKYRRMLLTNSKKRKGAFAQLFGDSSIELVQALDRNPKKIYEGRFWGDPGLIQICMDVINMQNLKQYCEAKGFPFTVDSCAQQNHFNMGDASGHFTYIEDPDGTLIEFVETHKIQIIKKLGWNINLLKKNREKALPQFLFRLMGLNKVKKVKN